MGYWGAQVRHRAKSLYSIFLLPGERLCKESPPCRSAERAIRA